MHVKRKKHPITLLEIMIVILLIGLIGGVLSYNFKGSLERGKKFRTEEGMKRLKEILELEVERTRTLGISLVGPADSAAVRDCIRRSDLIPASNLDAFLRDGWNEPYTITESNGELHVTSYRLEQYNQSHG